MNEKELREAIFAYRKLAEKEPKQYLDKLTDAFVALARFHDEQEEPDAQKVLRKFTDVLDLCDVAAEKNRVFLPVLAKLCERIAGFHDARGELKAAGQLMNRAVSVYGLICYRDEEYFPALARAFQNYALFHQKSDPDKGKSIHFARESIRVLEALCELDEERHMPQLQRSARILIDWGLNEDEIIDGMDRFAIVHRI